MKTRIISAAFVSLTLITALPAVAQQPLSTPPSHGEANDASSAERSQYIQKAHGEIAEWRRELDDFSAKAAASGREKSRAAARDLNDAWARTEAEGNKLKAATADGWDRAKESFENASRAFSDTFNKARSQSNPPAKP